jgi:hypothetical protein
LNFNAVLSAKKEINAAIASAPPSTARAAERPQPRRLGAKPAADLRLSRPSRCGSHALRNGHLPVALGHPFEIPVQPSLVAGGDVWIICALFGTAVAEQVLAEGSVLGLSYRFPDPHVVRSRANRQPWVPLPPVAELPTYEDICTSPAKVWQKHLNNRIMSRLSSALRTAFARATRSLNRTRYASKC